MKCTATLYKSGLVITLTVHVFELVLYNQDYRKSPGPMTSSKSAVSLVEMDKKSEQSDPPEESHSDPTLIRTGR
jgi:hypothetical protein